ncbi:MAG: hypothetical protein D6722_12590 [Bacteroidetes bacterium]|nr:MAG: hypothetical protein D6722_12590 [Bacteroidota bacterium]
MRILLALVCLLSLQPLSAQPLDSLYWRTYLQPMSLVPESDTSSGFALLQPVIESYRFFFTAEQHWRTINSPIQFAFLRYLHQTAGVRHLILEGGYSYGYLLNRYLETGDERLLHKVVTNLPVCPEDQMAMFEALYAYNQSLPEADRIQVTGIDLEHAPELALQALHTMLPAGDPPASIARRMQQLRDLHQSPYYDRRQVKRFFKRLQRDLDRQEAAYRTYWGTDYELVQLIAINVLEGMEFGIIRAMIFPEKWPEREARMYQNFLTLAPRLKPGNYFAQFGALHTDIEKSFKWTFPSLAHRLNFFPESPVAGQVLTVSRYLPDMMQDYKPLAEYEAFRELVRRAKRQFPDQIVLASMIGEGSPFHRLRTNYQFLMLIDPELEKVGCD